LEKGFCGTIEGNRRTQEKWGKGIVGEGEGWIVVAGWFGMGTLLGNGSGGYGGVVEIVMGDMGGERIGHVSRKRRGEQSWVVVGWVFAGSAGDNLVVAIRLIDAF
jgi:hypothetical protein